MKRPSDLTQLIEELEVEIKDSTVEVEAGSKAVVHVEDADDDDETGIALSARECSLLLHSPTTVSQFYEALGSPKEATISLHEVEMEDAVIVALERTFTAVDEM